MALIVFCFGLMLGLIRAYFYFNPIYALPALMFFVGFRRVAVVYVFVLALSFSLGAARAAPYLADINFVKSKLGSEVVLNGVVAEDLSYHKSGQREFHIDSLEFFRPESRSVHGRLRIRSYQANNLQRGDKILVSGKIYRALGNRHGSIQYANIQVLEKSNSQLEKLRSQFFASVNSALPDPSSGLGLGFLVGATNTLPEKLNENLRTTGLTHIVAVSGYNLTILVLLARRILIGHSKRMATLLALGLLGVFLLLTGGAPSIVRASIVSFIGIMAWYFGRKVNPLVLLLLSVAISAYINPYFLWKDIGWYLSFTAFFGVLVLSPLITKRFFTKPPKLIGQLLIETSCAQLLTLPIITYIFGTVSVISMLANLAVLPFVPLAMAATFLAGTSNLVSAWFASYATFIARFVLDYIIQVTNFLAQSPFAVKEIKISLSQLVASYFLIIILCLILYQKTRNNSLDLEQNRLY